MKTGEVNAGSGDASCESAPADPPARPAGTSFEPPATEMAASSDGLWHALEPDNVFARLRSSAEGLTAAQAAERLQRHGPNVLGQSAQAGPLELILRQIHNPLIYVLIASGVLAILVGKGLDGLVVLGVVLLNTLIGFIQEYRAGRAIEALAQMVPNTATVLRDGERVSVPAAEIVPGDVVLMQSGDKVPADMRLLQVRNLHVDEAALTGESVPAEKSLAAVAADAGVGDRLNMAFGGTLVTYGTATAVVVATGRETELGRISAMLNQASHLETPLTRQMAVVGRWLTFAILAVAVVLGLIGVLRGYHWIDAKLAAITLAVAAIPEGLPAIITIALAIGVHRMAGRQAVIRRLPAVETLGSATVICSDKTGTLTRNEMTVQELWTPAGWWTVSGVGYKPEGRLHAAGQAVEPNDEVRELLLGGALCNDAGLRQEDGHWHITGDPTEGALVVAAQKLGVEPEQARDQFPRVDAIPFESERQFMATLHREPQGAGAIYLKGAPEVVLKRCTGAAGARLDEAEVLHQVESMASHGMRVLAVCGRTLPTTAGRLMDADVESGFRLLGLVGMIDPPRPEAIAAIEACRQAGIAVKMITGDHKTTAQAIGEQLGLMNEGPAVSGRELEAQSDEALRETVRRSSVFARVAPEHKLRLVRALQANGHVVAMTGDGVNDAPALKQANIGVAMGITGTAVAKESADMVLANDNFASIAAAVEEGRRVYDNLIKALAFVLPTNLGEAMIILIAVLFFPMVATATGALEPLMPMLPVQILWINLVATVALALPLAFEAMEPDIMRRPPRRPDQPILSTFVLTRTAITALLMTAGAIGLFLYEYYTELPRVGAQIAMAEAQTMAVTTVILFQMLYLLNCRSLRDSMLKIGLFSNPSIYIGLASLLALQLAFVYLPFMNRLFGTHPLNLDAWLKSLLVALTIVPVISAEKWWRQRRAESRRLAATG